MSFPLVLQAKHFHEESLRRQVRPGHIFLKNGGSGSRGAGRRLRGSALFAALMLVVFGSLTAHAYDAIVVFGDSYNDVGNIYSIAKTHGIVYPPPPYYMGRFSNGPIWIEHIASDWGLPLTPSFKGGTDWAEGGALLLQTVTVEGLPIPSIQDQVAAYLARHHGKADPHALYVIEGGGNDILNVLETGTPDPALGSKIATALNGMVTSLRHAGAKSFLVPDLIDVGQLPAAQAGGPEFVTYASDMSVETNRKLVDGPRFDRCLYDAEIYRIATFRTFLAVANATTHFGFTNVTTGCLESSPICTDPDHTLWWDDEHPTEFGHAFFAVLVEGRLANH